MFMAPVPGCVDAWYGCMILQSRVRLAGDQL
jgi:hypothetical protein